MTAANNPNCNKVMWYKAVNSRFNGFQDKLLKVIHERTKQQSKEHIKLILVNSYTL